MMALAPAALAGLKIRPLALPTQMEGGAPPTSTCVICRRSIVVDFVDVKLVEHGVER
jgi:hypothetical protein